MVNEFSRSEDSNSTPSPAQVELLKVLLEPDDAPYPWNPALPDSEAYFVEAEQYVGEDWLEEEIAARALSFFSELDRLWSDTTTPIADSAPVTDVSTLQATLRSGFAARIPHSWLDAIAHRAHQVFFMERSMADKLVHCVQSVLPHWAEEELLALAHPFAHNMRCTQTTTAHIKSVLLQTPSQEWTALSEIEKARISLAIARYALGLLQSGQEWSFD